MRERIGVAHCGAAATVVALILLATLVPGSEEARSAFSWCLLCGERALADALRNLLLYVPLGVVLAWASGPLYPAVLGATALSLMVEITQAFVPGRDPSITDVIFNGLGAFLGAVIASRASVALYPDARTARRLAAGAVSGFALLVIATATLLAPAPSASNSAMLVSSGGDLMLRFPSRGGALRLDEPEYRVMREPAEYGESVANRRVIRERSHWRVLAGSEEQRVVGPTAGMGWAMIGYPEAIGQRWSSLLSGIWLGLLTIPAGYWARGRGFFLAAAVLAILLAAVPAGSGILPTPPGQWAGSTAGLLLGALVHRLMAARGSRFPRP